MDMRILGPLEVWVAGRPLALGGSKQRAVLAMLALHANQVVAIDQLIDGLWGQSPPDGATNVVQVYISRLRKTLHAQRPEHRGERPAGHAAAVLARRPPGYLLHLDPDELDLARFEQLAGQGTRALPGAPELAGARLREALALWRGPALAEFTNEPFAQAERIRLQEQRLAALQARIEADLTLGRHTELVSELRALVAEYPLREGLHQQLLLSLYRSGRQAEALAAYQQTRKILAEELGIDPSRALQALEGAILAQDRHLDWTPPPSEPTPAIPVGSTPRTTAADALPVVWNVPPRNPHFTGRTSLLDQLHQRLHAGEPTLVVQALYGLGGVGKTQLAIEYAHRFAADYQLVWWINTEQPVLIADQLAQLAGKLNLPPRATVTDTVELVLADLRRRAGWLLIFDNAEHPEYLGAYQPGGAGHVLITSRHPGWGALGGRLEVDVLTRPETVALLQRRIPKLDTQLAEQLAAELGDLPLAAAQAAAYLEETGLPAADYLQRFRSRRASLLAKGDILGYHGRLDTTWTLSLERLRTANPAAVLLLQLAAFLAPEPIPLRLFTDHPELLHGPLRAAASDPDTLDDVLGAVVSLSLARRHADSFQLHRLVQAAICQQLTPTQQQRMIDQVLTLLAAAHPSNPNDPANWAAYAQLAAHVLVAGAGEERSDIRRLMLSTVDYLNARGDSRASRRIAQQLLDRWREHLGPDHPDTLRSATVLTFALANLGEAEQARILGQATLERSRRVLGPDHMATVDTAAGLTVALAMLGEAEQAGTLGRDTLERARRALGPDHPHALRSAASLTLSLINLGEAEQARILGQDTLERCTRVLGPDHMATMGMAAGLTYALAEVGEYQQARTLGEDTLERCTRVLGPDHLATFYSATGLTCALAEVGEHQQARTLGEGTLERCTRVLGPDHPITRRLARALDSIPLAPARRS